MTDKKGFVQIELIAGILLFSFFILIVAGYTTKIKIIYHSALKKIEALSLARTILEAQKDAAVMCDRLCKESSYTVSYEIVSDEKIKHTNNCIVWSTITISNNNKELLTLMYVPYKKTETVL